MKKLLYSIVALAGVAGVVAILSYKPRNNRVVAAPTPAPVSPAASPASGTNPAVLGNGTFAGDEVSTVFGPVQVNAIITDGKLTDIIWVKFPNDRDKSIQISTMTKPIFVREALTAQSASVDVVSGATQTWEGFTQSLGSALERARS